MTHSPLVLIILDGWGYREDPAHNAIAAAKKLVWDELWQTCPHTLLNASSLAVGLPEGQMGNSEVGHLTMGAGRTIYQELTRIDKAIEEGEFFRNDIFLEALAKAKANNKAVHVLGLLSPGGVHSHEYHIQAFLELAVQQGIKELYVHAFLDGRDMPPKSAEVSIKALEQKFAELEYGRIASIIGRYYAMDRDKRWERVQCAYDLVTQGKADYQAITAFKGLQAAYARDETDEFVQATVIGDPVKINDGDVVVFMNYRADRARELSRAFTETEFTGFQRQYWPQLTEFVSLTQYAADIQTAIAFPPQTLSNVIGEYVAKHDIKQLRIAETEKYAHVTFFFNGGIETPSAGEERILVPSPKVATYDLKPEMSAPEVTERLVAAIQSKQYGMIICNFANPDMVGHTGNFAATVRAIETMDDCIGKIIQALREVGGEAIITSDHGNAEYMYDETTHQPHTAHTNELAPFLYVGRPARIAQEVGTLADISPTMLYLMDLPQPPEMTGKALLVTL